MLRKALQEIRSFLLDEQGDSLIQFALLFLFIAIVAAAVLPRVRGRIENAFERGGQKMDEAVNTIDYSDGR